MRINEFPFDRMVSIPNRHSCIVPSVRGAGLRALLPKIVPAMLTLTLMLWVGVLRADNRIQSENTLAGTAAWKLTNPITPGWPNNQDAVFPEIEGYASATSVNTNEAITFYVDVRVPAAAPRFAIEVFRMGYYSGLGARQMSWWHGGVLTNRTEIQSVKQIIPSPDPVSGKVECAWIPSYVLTIPPDWVSGVYVAKLTALPLGKQSYLIFVVREDDRSSDFLFQSSVTTFQAYNPWGGKSLYNFPGGMATEVSFNRPYAASGSSAGGGGTPPRAELLAGAGAGEFFTTVGNNPGPAWEYNMVRWLERQGFDLTYATSIDTHVRTNLTWPGKRVKALLSVGHDEYWSEEMRANVEGGLERGMNLGVFSANVCYWRVRFDQALRTMDCRKSVPFNFDLWRRGQRNQPEAAFLGVQYLFNTVDLDMTLPDPLPVHWIYDHASVSPGEVLPGLLGYEIDGEWDVYPSSDELVRPPSPPGTVRLSSTAFRRSAMETGHSFSSYYEKTNGAKVFASGSMQWNWGLDDYNAQLTRGQASRVSRKAQQMTYNLLNRFRNADSPTRPISFLDSDTVTRGNWEQAYGVEGYAVADGTKLDRQIITPSARVLLSEHVPVLWSSKPIDSRALHISKAGPDRVAGAWTTETSMQVDLTFVGEGDHQVALYCVDWLGIGIEQRIELFDPASPEVILDTRDLVVPTNGVYLVWTVTGSKALRVTNAGRRAGSVAAVSGIFLGADGLATFQRADVGTVNSGTRGNWITDSGAKRYGREGYDIVRHRTKYPPYASVQWNGVSSSLWTMNPLDVRSLRLVDERDKPLNDRIAASWNSSQAAFSFDLDLSDDRAHEVSIYCLDWDGCTPASPTRLETIRVYSRNNGRLLDERGLSVVGSDFCNGTYLTWLVQGRVRIQVRSLNPPNKPVISALFFDPDPRPNIDIELLTAKPGLRVFDLSWDAIPGENYRIEFTPHLSPFDWAVVIDNILATQNPEHRAIEVPDSSSGGFYRVVLRR